MIDTGTIFLSMDFYIYKVYSATENELEHLSVLFVNKICKQSNHMLQTVLKLANLVLEILWFLQHQILRVIKLWFKLCKDLLEIIIKMPISSNFLVCVTLNITFPFFLL